MAQPIGSWSSRVVVIGASAGGVEAIKYIASQLPPDFAAAVLVVLHIPHNSVSVLPDILRRAGPLPAVHASTREPMRPGRIYVAPPDRHMLITRSEVRAVFGPRENGHRPAVDPLFRSAAQAFGADAIGVVLTGNLDDGTAGLLAIKQAGGTAIVQDPADAMYPGMPRSAIHSVDADFVVRLDDVPETIVRLVS
ncbi:MAG TPA: chemotaxis protein CheB, partial [Gemmatimonadaceae bacterium]